MSDNKSKKEQTLIAIFIIVVAIIGLIFGIISPVSNFITVPISTIVLLYALYTLVKIRKKVI